MIPEIVENVAFLLFLSMVIDIGMYLFRSKFKTHIEEVECSAVSIGFTTLLFVLLLGFTINNLWGNFTTIGETMTNESEALLKMTRVLKGYSGTEGILQATRNYCLDILKNQWETFKKGRDVSVENEKLFGKIIEEANKYISSVSTNAGSSSISPVVLYSLIPKKEKLKIARLHRNGKYATSLNAVCAVIVLIGFLFVGCTTTDSTHVVIFGQILLNFGFVSVISICLFMLYEFQRPFAGLFKHGNKDFMEIIQEIEETR
jgi:hypothetical protein